MSVDVDVVVAGAGAAGLSAALRAAQSGRSVAVLEWREQFRHGNNTSMSTSMIPAGGSRWQQEAGIEDSPDAFLSDVMGKTGGAADPTISRALVDVAPALVEWLADRCGLDLALVTDFLYPGHSVPRCHSLPDRAGRSLLEGMLQALEREPTADLIVPARLSAVEPSGPDGAITARIVQPDGSSDAIRTSSVVLATGGFGADAELLAEHIPEIADGLYFGGDGCMGDAVHIGRALDLDLGYLDAYQGHGSVASPQNVLLTWATVMHGAVMVNSSGERFGDETIGYSEYGRMVLDQPGGFAWMVFDERIHRACLPFRDYQDLLSQGGVRWADDVAALAHATGLPEGELARTLDTAAAAAATGGTDVFGRDFGDGPPLQAPYAWVRVTGALFHTQGGLLIDGDARVMRRGEPVTGIYAAGGAAAGMSGHGAGGYMAGNGLLAALGLGYLAGSHASR